MPLNALVLALLGTILTGCATKQNFVMSDTAVLRSESHQMWTRPIEVGYEIVGDVEGSASAETILGFRVGAGGGSPLSSTLLFGLLGGGGGGAGNAVVGNAAYEAVTGAGADAIYITRYTETRTGFLIFYKRREATVYGKALRLVDYGVVPMDRADRARFPVPTARITVETE